VGRAIDPVWEVRSEVVPFRLGPFRLGEAKLKALTLVSNPFVVDAELAIPMAQAAAQDCRAVVVSAMPIGKRFATMCFDRGALRYAARYGDRYVVDLQGSFAEYLGKFSRKSRHELKRTVRRFGEECPGMANIVEYRTPSEISAFRELAIRISHRSYKVQTGLGFDESESFARRLELDAGRGIVRGFVLMLDDQPAAYGFCRIEHDVIVYKHTGYEEQFARRSPGKVLFYLMLETLFREGEFRLLDFDGMEYYAYKEFFATRAINFARVFWFQPRLPEISLFSTHWIVTAVWRLASLLRYHLRQGKRGWVSARTHLRGAPQ
jgi:CelD/BcsL family acetyltransferase involved in cellulose biosynthesis